MRDFEKPGRSEVFGTQGMAATSHPLATLTALDVLRKGGNAVDAAVAAAALLAVVEPSQTGIGGDCFALLKRERRPVVAINGSGAAPAAASVERLAALGVASLHPESAHSVTVPGAVRTWERLVRDYGTLEWRSLLAPAIVAAERGSPVTERLAHDWGRQVRKLSRRAATASLFLPGGRPPRAGDMLVQPALGRALRSIADEGACVFYEGWIAQAVVAALDGLGGLHTRDDFAAFQPRYEVPIAAPYRGFELWECPPNGSGVTALTMARLLDRYAPSSQGPASVERYHLLAEVARIAYAERDAFVGDPDTGPVPVENLLSEARAAAWSARIVPGGRLPDLTPVPAPEHKDTVYLSVVDRDRMAVSFINSLFDDFGSGIVVPECGTLLHNRGFGFVLEPGHPNVLVGGKRPMHTILPAMLTRDGEAEFVFGVTGGHFQPIGQMQVLANVVDYGLSVQAAIDHPRIFARGDVLEVESTLLPEAVAGLRAHGHRPILATQPLGTAQAIWIDRKRGLLRGGADPRREGIALGY